MTPGLEQRAVLFLTSASASFTEELADIVPPWTPEQRRRVELYALLHLRSAWLRGVSDCAQHVRQHGALPPAAEQSIAAALLRAMRPERGEGGGA